MATSTREPAALSEDAAFDPREVDVVIIGAGHNGLTAGCYLPARDWTCSSSRRTTRSAA